MPKIDMSRLCRENCTQVAVLPLLLTTHLALFTAVANAQDAGTGSSQAVGTTDAALSLEEVVVTARRREESLAEVPASITALSANELQAQAIFSDADLQRAVPGLLVRESLSSNQVNYSIRGQSVDAFSSSSPGVLAYVNEFQATSTGASSFYDLESIQVLKGPQGTLYGRNTTGGAVLLTTAKPTEEFSASVTGRMGNYGLYSGEGFVNFAIADDKALVRLSAKILKQDGFQDNLFNGKELGAPEYQTGRISVLLRPTDYIESLSMFQYDESSGQNVGSVLYNASPCAGPADASCTYNPAVPFWPAYLAGNPGVDPNGLSAFADVQRQRGPYDVSLNSDLSHDGDQILFVNNTTIELSPNLTLKNVIGYIDSTSDDSTDVDGSPYAIYANGLWDGGDRTQFGNEQWSEEFQIQGIAFDQQLEYLIGAYYGYEKKNFYIPTRFFDLRPVIPDVPSADKDNEQESKNFGVFAHGSYDLGELTGINGLGFTAGYRHTWEDVEVKHLPRSLYYQLGIAPEGLENDFDNPSWNIGFDYQTTDELLLYIVQRGSWRSGGFNTNSPLFEGTIDVGGSEFAPETTEDIELGLKFDGQLGGKPAQLNIAAYMQEVEDIQRVVYVTVPQFGPTALTANIPKAEINGVELSGQMLIADWLRLGANVSYTDAEFTDNEVVLFGVSTAFGPYPDTPEWSGSAFAEITLPISPSYGDVTFRTDVFSQSKFYFSSLDDTINPGTDLPSYTLVNFRLSWSSINQSPLSTSVFVTNAFDEEYYTGGLALGSVLGVNAAVPGRRRMYGIEFSYDF
ncbi:TonB-dependent receptor [Haliea sp.]